MPMSLKIGNLKAAPHLASLLLIAHSRIFDANWYKTEYPESVARGFSPLVHYLLEGARQGARPHILFDPAWYRRSRAPTQRDQDPLLDYIKYGAAEGFEPSPYFSSSYYRKLAGDLRGLTPLGHFIAHGLPRGVSPTLLFDRDWYLSQNPDVREVGFDPFLHFVASGSRDGRSPGPLFDASWYRMKNADVRDRGFDPLPHYLAFGAAEGRKPHERFDPAFYVAKASDPLVTPENALVEYAEVGREQWRSSHAFLPPPDSPVAAFEQFPWRHSGSPRERFDAPFRVLIVDLAPSPSARARNIELRCALNTLPQLDVHILTNAPPGFAQAGGATLDLSRSEFASLDHAIVVDRLLRALKFRDPRALVIEAENASPQLPETCAALNLPYYRIDVDAALSTAEWTELLHSRMGYCALPRPTISVIIPNYNHARYLDERLKSIFAQQSPPDEIIFLDDASADESLAIARASKAKSKIPFAILTNPRNSGSPFKQWAKGVSHAKCDLVWIAESDDSSDPRFLQRMAESFTDPDVVLAYSDSEVIGTQGEILAQSYRFYTDTLDELKWLTGYVESGASEILTTLAIKNTIPNVSSAVFKRTALVDAIRQIQDFRYCGDWRAYLACLRQGKISFRPEALNRHRQEPGGVTQGGERATLGVQEALVIKQDIFAHSQCTNRVVWLSLAQTVFEYEMRSLALAGGRPAFTASEALANSLHEMSIVIGRQRPHYFAHQDEVSLYVRALAESSTGLDRAAREALVARVLTELRVIAKREA
ncbi:Glycosyl transferase family 2 [Methylocella tundrae]|nr:Glycosyl transferase family 2 [Methylocella tundrae]